MILLERILLLILPVVVSVVFYEERGAVTLISYAFIRETKMGDETLLLQVKWSFHFIQGVPILNSSNTQI